MRLGLGLALNTRRGGASPVVPILDGISGAGIVLSLDRLRTAYSGTVVTIRRVSPAAEEEFSYDALGRLDIAAILAFAGDHNAHYVQWWDASVNARHFSQSTAGNQPLAVSGGVFYPPAFDGTNDVLKGNSASLNVLQNVPAVHAFTVASSLSRGGAVSNIFFASTVTSGAARLSISLSADYFRRVGVRRLDDDSFASVVGGAASETIQQRTTCVNYAAGGSGSLTGRVNGAADINGTLSGTGNTSNTASAGVAIGATDNDALHSQGVIKEVILFPSILSDANRNAIESSQIARR
jgi:hypothetical protein